MYSISLLLIGVLMIGAIALPRWLSGRAISFPILYVFLGTVLFNLPIEWPSVLPEENEVLTERLTELAVILALMGGGLKLQRPMGWRSWNSVWRLLGITMPLCILVAALLGWAFLGMTIAGAMLLGAVLAPTDPVLASDVQVRGAMVDSESEVRFGLTAEAGLNDGLAFPFVNLAVALALASSLHPGEWMWDWVAVDVVYKIIVGVAAGLLSGTAIAWVVFHSPAKDSLARAMEGSVALAATLIAYGLTELIGGYGFLAVFFAAIRIRHWELCNDYHEKLLEFTEDLERLFMTVLLVLVGGAIAQGMLASISWQDIAFAVVFLLLIRPATGLLALVGCPLPGREKLALAFFGIRGIGSIYYLAYAVNHASFEDEGRLWACVILVIVASIVIHGISASPFMKRMEQE